MCRKFPPQLKEEELNAAEDGMVCAEAISTADYYNLLFAFLYLSEGGGRKKKKGRMSHLIFAASARTNPPEFPGAR